MDKVKVAIFWAASCGGCDIATIDIHEVLLDVLDKIEFVFWPCVMDFKYDDLKKMPDKSIDVTFFNGAIRNSENEEVAHILRKKSKLLVAFGACSSYGGIPALSNLYNNKMTFDSSYISCPSVNNPDKIIPQTETEVSSDVKVDIPELYDTVLRLSDVVDVDYFVPGCPPVPSQIINIITALLSGKMPPLKSVVGAGEKNLCEECPREKKDKKIKKFLRSQEIEFIDPDVCLLEQGIICCGPATRSGCGAKCPSANLGCRGCYGPASDVKDQGLKMLSALASVIDSNDEKEIDEILNTVVDTAGTFYRFTMSDSLLKRKAVK